LPPRNSDDRLSHLLQLDNVLNLADLSPSFDTTNDDVVKPVEARHRRGEADEERAIQAEAGRKQPYQIFVVHAGCNDQV